MPGPCSGKHLISILVTNYIQKRRDQALLFSFEYNLLPNFISNFNHYMDRAFEQENRRRNCENSYRGLPRLRPFHIRRHVKGVMATAGLNT